jgi:23S rRNA (uracil1939-C5)-methyltransferase
MADTARRDHAALPPATPPGDDRGDPPPDAPPGSVRSDDGPPGDRPEPERDELIDVLTTGPASDGSALGRHPDGRVVFVTGALPGESVAVRLTEQRRDYRRGTVAEVLVPSPDRVTPECAAVAAGCGGCDLQHLRAEAQPALKRAIVADALRRLGGVSDPRIEEGPPLPARAFRTTVRAAVVDGRAGFRRGASHDVVPVDRCLVAHPRIEDLLRRGRFAGCTEVTVRVGAATGECLVVADPAAAEVELSDLAGTGADAPTRVVGADELDAGTRAWIHEIVEGQRFRVSARSFFQTRTDGAAALAATVRELGGDDLAGADRVVDAYAGVGLLAARCVPATARVTAVEVSPSSVADARRNLAGREGGAVTVVRTAVERWHPRRADVVIADPARTGLGRRAAAVLARTGAGVVILVSCDAAALGRDARLLAGHGFRHEGSTVVDLFPHTHHVEVVSRFVR